MLQMDGMVAIVTGASRGLGKAIAMEFGREGATMVVCARYQSPTGLVGTASETAMAINAHGGSALPVPCDVTDEAQVEELVARVTETYGRIDVLVNNAGVMEPKALLWEIEPHAWDQMMAVNLRAPYLTCRAVVPVMLRQRHGNIINIGSPAGSTSRIEGGAYCSSKAALHTLTLCLAKELKEHNIAVNVFDPGPLRSEGSAAIPWAWDDWHLRVEPQMVAPCCVYLALQDGNSLTDQVLHYSDFGVTWGPGALL